jgi:hypothetical protein
VTGFVYRWHDRKHNRYYFGSHWGSPDDGYVCSSKWMKDAHKKRPDDFAREIVAVVDTSRKDLLRLEQYWLDRIHKSQFGKAVYNLNGRVQVWHADDQKRKTTAEKISAGNLGKILTAETRAKISSAVGRRKEQGWKQPPCSAETRARMSAAHKGLTLTPEHREKISAGKTGRTFSPEHRARISAAQKGLKRGPLSPETRAKISTAHKGLKRGPLSPEHRARISAGGKGLKRGPLSPETRAKISAAIKCLPPSSPETRANISATVSAYLTGRKKTPEARAAISAAIKGKPWTAARRLAHLRRNHQLGG